MNTDQLAIFVQAARGGSLSEAARRLRLTAAAASRGLASLEAELGVRLAHRSTRSFALTSDGEAFLRHAESIVESTEAARESLVGRDAPIEGLLRVGSPIPLAQRVVVPLLPALLKRHPKLQVDLQVTDAFVDVVQSGFDVGLRIGALADSGLVARRLAPSPRVLCAAPSYVARRGLPTRVADLAKHDCLIRTGSTGWTFVIDGRERTVTVFGRLSSNSHLPLRRACVEGLGIAIFALWDAVEDLESGRLVRLSLDSEPVSNVNLWAVFPSRTLVPAKVRVFVDALSNVVRGSGWSKAT